MDNTTIKSIFSRILRELMNKNPRTGESVSVKNLSQFLGVSVHAIYYYLSSKTVPDYPQLFNLARYFGVSIDYLLTGQQAENKLIREALHLPDTAINNLESIDKNLASFIGKILSDKEFYAKCQKTLKEIQASKELYIVAATLKATGGDVSLMLKNLGYIKKAISNINSQIMRDYFYKFFEGIIKAEFPANEVKENTGND